MKTRVVLKRSQNRENATCVTPPLEGGGGGGGE